MSGNDRYSDDLRNEEELRPRKAAMYVRMSTDHQKYSTENQEVAIREYADRRNIELVKIYTDGGRSGLNFSGRSALQNLIADVQEETKEYSIILIYDVTRWGRYQDVDESAYYEFICRRAGYSVHYVAEQFTNDGSLQSNLMKNIKRSMAGEYSRELSVKVFAGQCRLIEKGFRQGGPAGYGLRRTLIDEKGEWKAELKQGEHKSLQTDRVILVPGPEEEIQIVRWIYKAFIEDEWSERQIADDLNRRGIQTDFGRQWTRATVHQVLTNEKYIGTNVYNRRSYKLKEKRINNPEEQWIKKEGAFEAVVEPRYFYTAQGIIRERNRKISNDEMLDKLRSLCERQGWLSGILIDETEDMPTSSAYMNRFGSLTEAYKLIGYDPGRDVRYIEINRHLRRIFPEIVENVINRIKEIGGNVWREVGSDLLFVNGEIKVSVVICRCHQTGTGSNRWKMHLDTSLQPDLTVAIRMDPTNTEPMDYYLLPALDIENPKLRLMENNHVALDAYRFDDLEAFFVLTERAALPEAA